MYYNVSGSKVQWHEVFHPYKIISETNQRCRSHGNQLSALSRVAHRSHPDYVREVGTELCIKIWNSDRDQKFGEHALVHEKNNREPDAEALIEEVLGASSATSLTYERNLLLQNKDLHEQLLL